MGRRASAGDAVEHMADFKTRRSDYDVTNRIQVSDPASVSAAVQAIYSDLYPRKSLKPLHTAFADFARMYRGEDPRFHGCETTYHDMQHSLDVTLALARHIDGHDRSQTPSKRVGAKRAMVGIVSALYHDVGYLRSTRDRHHRHGAEYTLTHVTRSSSFLGDYLKRVGLGSESAVAGEMVHYTGYERDINRIQLGDDGYTRLGHLLGTADLTAQMADRCYLEKCRDRLYQEFVMGGMARRVLPDGRVLVLYSSPQDLLQKTPGFFEKTRLDRLDGTFAGAHRYAAKHFGGQSLYMEAVRHNLAHLGRIIRDNGWAELRRRPPLFTAEEMRWKGMPPLRSQRMKEQSKRAAG
ncbi:MAG TPA: hypothetical protein VHP13_11320 [Gammaproteobacteria bacterium]|nr:hypothetical protein [Gammaproteobacteria bacterium]